MHIRFNIVLAASVALLSTLFACKKEKLDWQQVQKLESHCNHRLNNIYFLNDTLGYTVGGLRFDKSTILVTKDGGNTWELHDIPEAGKSIFNVAQKPTGEVYAVGFDGKLLRTTDGGDNWSFFQMNSYQPYKDLTFIEPSTGIIIGGISFNYGVMAYIDDQNDIYRYDTFNYELNDIEMLDNRTGYISGYGVVLKTADGAVKWKLQDIKNDNFTAIHAQSENELWVCGYNGSIYYTSNGGEKWEQFRSGNDIKKPRYRLLDIYFKDRTNGWAVGEEGVVIHTTDGGHSWDLYKKFTSNALRCITQTPDGQLIVCGDNGSLYKLLAH
ncbi:WD40/YVTN/BNR-like repeat-containing protein [Polluticoccus soli]|uniref:WD40/YVTN/BNR-like repeat-containing protein n=1 Tax=Polluticoccus soli TaxID=3034150 RepID=UPI0023E31A65|nr:YCF48-related protein [Flavipsychrobacter sp. JY13-12]